LERREAVFENVVAPTSRLVPGMIGMWRTERPPMWEDCSKMVIWWGMWEREARWERW
jgi:hypothetical protein